MVKLGLILLAASTLAANPAFKHRMDEARAQYFAGLEGERGATDKARLSFAALSHDYPDNPAIEAYNGSLELLDAAHTWAIWDKHRLANEGLQKLDHAVDQAPGDLEARFIRAASTWHLPFFFKRKEQSEADFVILGPQAESAAAKGSLPPQLAAAALDYYGQILADRNNGDGARQAFEAALRVDGDSPAGKDAKKRLKAE